ncbi:MAG: hypothetical protein CL681_23605 [Blastopirellula sp.]|nr:hypothetical protein [Blastopirellula sp.]
MNSPAFAKRKRRRKHRARIHPTFLAVVQALADDAHEELGKLLQQTEFDYVACEDFLWDHRLYGLAYGILEDVRLRDSVPAWFQESLREHREASTAQQDRLLECLCDIDGQFQASGIDYRLLKGFALSNRLYPAPERREQGDLDLLVPPVQVQQAIAELETLGFQSEVDVTWRSLIYINEVLLRRATSKIDMHWTLQIPSQQFSLNEKALWSRPQQFTMGGRSLPTVSDEYCLVGLLLSIAEDLGAGKCRIKLFVDLYLFVTRCERPIDWQTFLQRRRAEGLAKLSTAVLSMLAHLFQENQHLRLLAEQLHSDPHSWRATREETWELLQNPRDDVKNQAWLESLRPVTTSGAVWWYLRKITYYLRFQPSAIPLAVLRKLHIIRGPDGDARSSDDVRRRT